MTTSPRSRNRFERHSWLLRLVLLVLALGLVEALSAVLVHLPGFYKQHNREPSGYYVFRNNPDKENRTWQRLPGDSRVVTDPNGFVSRAPVARQKAPETTRIFLMGGSTAFGAVQNSLHRQVHAYPRGMYTFRDSIAGQLQAFLEARQPGRHFEVVTAAAVSRSLHQSLAYYLETVSRFSPDWVVNLEGFNDLPHLYTGTPYADREHELRYYFDIQNGSRCLERLVPRAFCLVEGIYNRLFTEWTRGRRRPVPDFARSFDLDAHTREDYLRSREELVTGAQRFLQIARHHAAALEADGVHFLFVLQPLLHRQGANKELSKNEERLAREVSPPLYTGLTHTPATARLEYLQSILALKYLFDDYLSDALREQLHAGGHVYLDMNRALGTVPASVELYSDYCHLTLEGNRRVAERIGEAILTALPATGG